MADQPDHPFFGYLLGEGGAPPAAPERDAPEQSDHPYFGYLLGGKEAFTTELFGGRKEYAERTIRAGQMVGRPAEETQKLLAERGVQFAPEQRQQYELNLARRQSDIDWQNRSVLGQTASKFARSYAPFSEVFDAEGHGNYQQARARLQRGEAAPGDYRTIADYERNQEYDRRVQESFAGKVVSGVGSLSRIVGEAAAGRSLAGTVGAAAPTSFKARAGLNLLGYAAVPGMYVEDARRRNLEENRAADDPAGYGPALALGYANWLVLGRLQNRFTGQTTAAGRYLGAPALGTLESAAVELVDSYLEDKPERGGPIRHMIEGKFGEGLQDAAATMITFAVAGGMHKQADRLHDRFFGAEPGETPEGPPPAPEPPPESKRVAEAFGEAVDSLTKPRAPLRALSDQAAGVYLSQVNRRLTEVALSLDPAGNRSGKVPTAEEAMAQLGEIRNPAVRDYAQAVVESLLKSGNLTTPRPVEPGAKAPPATPEELVRQRATGSLPDAGTPSPEVLARRADADLATIQGARQRLTSLNAELGRVGRGSARGDAIVREQLAVTQQLRAAERSYKSNLRAAAEKPVGAAEPTKSEPGSDLHRLVMEGIAPGETRKAQEMLAEMMMDKDPKLSREEAMRKARAQLPDQFESKTGTHTAADLLGIGRKRPTSTEKSAEAATTPEAAKTTDPTALFAAFFHPDTRPTDRKSFVSRALEVTQSLPVGSEIHDAEMGSIYRLVKKGTSKHGLETMEWDLFDAADGKPVNAGNFSFERKPGGEWKLMGDGGAFTSKEASLKLPTPPEKPPESPPPAEPPGAAETPPAPEVAQPSENAGPGLRLGPGVASPKNKGGEKTLVRHEFLDPNGNSAGYIDLSQSGLTLNVDWTGLAGAAGGEMAGRAGVRFVREAARQLAAAYPDAILIRGVRSGGAHKGKVRSIDLEKVRRGEEQAAPPEAPKPTPEAEPTPEEIPFDTAGLEEAKPAPTPVPTPQAASPRARRPNESDTAYRRRLAREKGEVTLYDEIHRGPGLDLKETMGVDDTAGTDPRTKGLLRKGGEDPNIVAARHGFSSPDELLKAIRAGRTVEESAKAQDARLEEDARKQGEEEGAKAADPVQQRKQLLKQQWLDMDPKDREPSGDPKRPSPGDVLRRIMRMHGVAVPRGKERNVGGRKAERDVTPLDPETEGVIAKSNLPESLKGAITHVLQGGSQVAAAQRFRWSTTKIADEGQKLFGESLWDRLSAQAEDRRQERAERLAIQEEGKGGGEDDLLFAPPGGGQGAELGDRPVALRDAKTPLQILQADRDQHGVPNYRDTPPGGTPEDIAFNTRVGAVMTGGMATQDVARGLHDIAHGIEAKYGFPTNPASLPADVRAGLAQFNYNPALRGRQAMQEGFAEWYRRRQTGQLDPDTLSPQQRAASEFAEQWAKEKGLTDKFDATRDAFAKYAAQPAGRRAASHLSPTGERDQRAKGAGQRLQELKETWDDDLAVLSRLEGDTGTSGVRAAFSRLLFGNRQAARDFREEGYYTIANGKKTTIGIPFKAMIEGHRPEWLTPYGKGEGQGWAKRALGVFTEPNKASPLDVFMVARHAIDERERGRQFLPDDQQKVMEDAYAEFRKDPEFFKWAAASHDKITRFGFNAGLDALAAPEVHRLAPEFVENMKAKRPTYVPTTRVKQEFDTRVAVAKLQGASPPGWTKPRVGSGEPIVAPLRALEMRYKAVAQQLTMQLRMNKIASVLGREGSGAYLLAGELKDAEHGELRKGLFDELEGDGAAVAEAMRATGGGEYFSYKPWPSDGTKPTVVWFGPGGERTAIRVGDESLYNLLTNQQVDANQFAKLVNFLTNVQILGVKPVKAMQKVQRAAATAFSVGFQARNIPLDVFTFLTNTNRRNSVWQLPAAYARAFKYEMDVLRGRVPKDDVFSYFMGQRGKDLKMMKFDPNDPGSIYEEYGVRPRGIVPAVKSGWGILKQVLNTLGAGENAPRFVEWRTRMKDKGWPEEKIAEALRLAREDKEAGKPYVDPVDEALKDDSIEAGAEVTVPFQRQGVLTRQLNDLHPFFGPAVAGLSKSIRNWKTNAKGASMAMGIYLGMRLIQWLSSRDEEWYRQQNAFDRYQKLGVNVPGVGPKGLPVPRGFEIPVGAAFLATLDAATDRNPDLKGLITESLESQTPPLPITPAGAALRDVARNRTFTGKPVVPASAENLSETRKALNYQLPYALSQLSGGRVDVTKDVEKGLLGAVGLPVVRDIKPHRSLDDFYDRSNELRAGEARAKLRGEAFADRAEYLRMERVRDKITDLNHLIRGDRKQGESWVGGGEPPAEERKKELEDQRLRLAKQAMGVK